jgi:tetratricopeptide (TPR) repeat protein
MAAVAAVLLLLLVFATHHQLQFWRNGITLFQRCLEVTRDSIFVEFALAGAYDRAGDWDSAIVHYRRSMEIPPNRIEVPRALRIMPQIRLAQILQQQGRWEEAIAEFEVILQKAPARWDLRASLADCLVAVGQFAKAAKEYKTVLEGNPNNSEAWRRLGIALNSYGESNEARDAYREAVRLGPYRVEALNDLAWFLATDAHAELRDGAEAIKLAQKACALTGEREPRCFGTLDAAYAEAGDFKNAIATARRTIQLATDQKQPEIAAAGAKRLELYQASKPYHAGN